MIVVQIILGIVLAILLGAAAGFVIDKDPRLDKGTRAFGVVSSVALAVLMAYLITRTL